MNKTIHDTKQSDDEMRPEYDFAGGVRGKHYQAYLQGHSVTIHHADGTTTILPPPNSCTGVSRNSPA